MPSRPATAADDPAQPRRTGAVGRLPLFLGFLKAGLLGFGGVAPWARRIIVEERGWLSEAEYAAVLGVGQILPGANTVNAAVIIGQRFQGLVGSLIAVAGLMAAPLAILVGVATLYAHVAAQPDVHAGLSGVSAAAAGLVIGTALKMARGLRGDVRLLAIGGLAFVAVALFHLPLIATVAVLAPVGIVVSLAGRRR